MPQYERILTGGPAGSGKTHNWLTIAEALPKSKFHVIDPEDGVERIWRDTFPSVNNINYYFVPSWFGEIKEYGKSRWAGGVVEALTKIRKEVKPGDWAVVESLSALWDMVQDGFVGQVFNMGIGEYFLEVRKALASDPKRTRLDALEGWKDWAVIKKLHNDDFLAPICYKLGVHVYASTSWSVISERERAREDAEVHSFYGNSDMRFEGEKRNPFRMHTLLISRGNKKEGFYLNTFLKDRGARRWLENVKVTNFFTQYLVAIAGWSGS